MKFLLVLVAAMITAQLMTGCNGHNKNDGDEWTAEVDKRGAYGGHNEIDGDEWKAEGKRGAFVAPQIKTAKNAVREYLFYPI